MGIFFVAVQTFTRKLFAVPLKSKKSEEMMRAIRLMLQVRFFLSITSMKKTLNTFFLQDKHFGVTKKLLFDGESALASPVLKKKIYDELGIYVHAEPGYHRSLAERAVKGWC